MKIAFDVNVADAEIGRLVRLGFEVVCVARRAEPDDSWIERAVDNGAQIIFSNDLDVPNYLDRQNYDDVQYRKMWHSKNLLEEVWKHEQRSS